MFFCPSSKAAEETAFLPGLTSNASLLPRCPPFNAFRNIDRKNKKTKKKRTNTIRNFFFGLKRKHKLEISIHEEAFDRCCDLRKALAITVFGKS